MSAEDLERYEADMELQLYQEYRDVLGMFQYVPVLLVELQLHVGLVALEVLGAH